MSTTASVTPATLQNLLAQMQQDQDVLNGWDVVFNMQLDPVDQLFALLYADQAPGPWQAIDVAYCQVVPDPGGQGQLVAYTDLQATLSGPSLTFPPNNPSFAQITFAADGRLRQASAPAPADFDPASDCTPADPSLNWATTPLAAATFVASVPLTVLDGRTVQDANGFRVVLDFPSGSFQLPTVANAPEPTRLTTELRNYFAANAVQYVLNQVDTQVVNQLPALTPKAFKLNTLQTNAGNSLLQFFVATIGTEPANLTVNVNEPVPDGSQCSLMIRKGIADQLGGDSFRDLSLFALENLAFPGDIVALDAQYDPYDMLVIGHFDLAPTVAVSGGDHQQVQRAGDEPPGGIAQFAPLSVTVTDALGHPSAGTAVVFAGANGPADMAIQLDPGGASTVTATSDASGIATLDAMGGSSVSCYYDVGAFQVVATAPGGATATFDLTVAATPPPPNLPNATVAVVSGDGQQIGRAGDEVPGGIATFAPLSVMVKDPNGILIPNAEVNWAQGAAPSEMAVQLDPSGAAGKVTFTGADGVTTLDSFADGSSVYCYYATGAFQVVASVSGGAVAATFNLAVTS
jgi:hypothetical protein